MESTNWPVPSVHCSKKGGFFYYPRLITLRLPQFPSIQLLRPHVNGSILSLSGLSASFGLLDTITSEKGLTQGLVLSSRRHQQLLRSSSGPGGCWQMKEETNVPNDLRQTIFCIWAQDSLSVERDKGIKRPPPPCRLPHRQFLPCRFTHWLSIHNTTLLPSSIYKLCAIMWQHYFHLLCNILL